MTRTIYLVYDIPSAGNTGDWYQTCPTFDREEAVRAARGALAYLTDSEKSRREVYVGVHTVSIPDGDTRTASEIYRAMISDDAWPEDHDVITITEAEVD